MRARVRARVRVRRHGGGLILTLPSVALLLAGCGGSSGNVVNRPASSAVPGAASSAATPSGAESSATSSATAPGVSTSAGRHGTPRITITPNSNLAAQQAVQVTGTGFSPGEPLQAIQCADKGQATGPADCNLTGILPVTSDSNGAVRVTLQVTRGPFGGNNIVCGATQKCLVSVTQASLSPTEEADAPISFRP